ncbi:unnamed protein product [Withania somnifera]
MKNSTIGTSTLVLPIFSTLTSCLDARLQACTEMAKSEMYTTYKCSPPVFGNTKGGDGGGPSECDSQYHSMIFQLLPLSTGWYSGGDRCLDYITISANGKSVKAKVVDECDSTMGCDDEHDYRPPYPNNIVDASKAVWEALGIPKGEWGNYDITWYDA